MGVIRMGWDTLRIHECTSKFPEIYGELPWGAPRREVYSLLGWCTVVFSVTFSEHIEHFREVLRRLKSYGVELKPRKCAFFKQDVSYKCSNFIEELKTTNSWRSKKTHGSTWCVPSPYQKLLRKQQNPFMISSALTCERRGISPPLNIVPEEAVDKNRLHHQWSGRSSTSQH